MLYMCPEDELVYEHKTLERHKKKKLPHKCPEDEVCEHSSSRGTEKTKCMRTEAGYGEALVTEWIVQEFEKI